MRLRRSVCLALAILVLGSTAAISQTLVTTQKVCHLYGQAAQGASAWNHDDACTIPNVDLLDTSYRQNDFICCGGGATSPTTNANIPPGLELQVTGGHYWSVANPRLVGDQFTVHTYCGPEPSPGPGCNVSVDVIVHYRVARAESKEQAEKGESKPETKAESPSKSKSDPAPAPSLGLDKILAFAFGASFALIMLFIAYKDRQPTPIGILIYRVVLALVAAGIGAVIPGMIDVNVNPVIRAGGAIALFVIVFWFNPPNLVTSGSTPKSS